MAIVNTNIGASVAQQALVRNERAMSAAMEQLSTGKKINSAADDAAGLAISSRMTAQIRGLDQAVRNANDGISMVNTAEGAMIEVTAMLQRMREITVQSANGTTDSADRSYLNKEYQALATEIQRVATNTQWNGRDILTGDAASTGSSAVSFQVGANGGQTISVTIGDISSTGNTTFAALQSSGASGSIATTTAASAQTVATSTLTAIDAAITDISEKRADLGAGSNQLTHAVDNLTSIKINAEESRSRILDTDYAQSTSELARTQIIQQAGTAMLAQANQLPQTVLALLQ
jgi:flagellin